MGPSWLIRFVGTLASNCPSDFPSSGWHIKAPALSRPSWPTAFCTCAVSTVYLAGHGMSLNSQWLCGISLTLPGFLLSRAL